MSMVSPESVLAAQILYLRKLTSLKRRVSGIVKLGEENSNLEKAAYESLEEIEEEVTSIQEYLKLLSYLQRGV